MGIIMILRYVFLFAYIILLPYNVYYLIRTIKSLRANRMSAEPLTEPPRAGALAGRLAEPERTCRAEQQKLIYILSRYYLNQDIMKQLKQELDSDTCAMTLTELECELDKLPFYEEVRPAAPAGEMGSGMKTFLAALVFAALILLIFHVW